MLKSDNITIIGLNQEAMEKTYTWINDADLRRSLGTKKPVSTEEHRQWFSKVSLDNINMTFAVQDNVSKNIIGIIGNKNTDSVSRNCTLFLYIGDNKYKRKNIGFEALSIYTDYLFAEMNMFKIQAWIYDFNIPSIKLFEKAGYKREAVFKKHWYKEGRFRDVYIYYKLGDINV